MDEITLWRMKLLQILHDPPGKPMAQWYRGQEGRGHAALGRALLGALGAMPARAPAGPDRMMSAADRPNTGPAYMCRVAGWHKRPLLSHPLAPHRVWLGASGLAPEPDEPDALASASLDVSEANAQQVEALEELAKRLTAPLGDDPQALRRAWAMVWRALPDQLAGLRGGTAMAGTAQRLWPWIPADTRCPDVSIWDHTRLTSAVAFFRRSGKVEDRKPSGPDEPWLLSVKIGPVGDFIAQARTARDLWLGSFLLAEISWAAMQPVIERYGPDAILYPDLRRNPRADRWLADSPALDGVLPEGADPRTRAAVIPNRWVAVVPRGGEGTLLPVRELGQACAHAAQARWDEIAARVWARLDGPLQAAGLGDAPTLKAAWEQQHTRVLACTWLAAPWAWMDGVEEVVGRGLPAQGPTGTVPADSAPPDLRRERFEPLLGSAVWARRERSRWSALAHWLHYGDGRGSDYPLHHMRLVRLHEARAKARPASLPFDLPKGEACTVCRARPVLAALDGGGGLETRRARLRDAWKRLGENDAIREPRFGEERLCAVCLGRRLLVRTGRPEDAADPNRTWTGGEPEWARDGGSRHLRFPFPSTATVAAQRWLCRILPHPELQSELQALNHAAKAVDWPCTAFAAALPALRDLAEDCPDPALAEALLKYDAQLFFPDALQATVARERSGDPRKMSLGNLVNASRALLKRCRKLNDEARKEGAEGPGLPDPRYAVLRVDGDRMGALLAGDADRLRVTWRDVLHPDAVRDLEAGNGREGLSVPWRSLMDDVRGTGPSLHATISRMLVDFAHRVVPWVIEQEFAGRLVYAGGDDLLALLPAKDALPAARRLQELFSAAWVIDRRPDLPLGDPPFRRAGRGGVRWDPEASWSRFRPVPAQVGEVDLGEGEIFPLLGPNQSLSAGVAIAHFKTALSATLGQAGTMLDEVAKAQLGRGAVGLAAYSRGGVKVAAGLKWRDAAEFQKVLEGFERAEIPGKLPYQLREPARALLAVAATGVPVDDLARELLTTAGKGEWQDSGAIHTLWQSGVQQVLRGSAPVQVSDANVDRITAPLRLARTLASTEEGEE